MLKTYAKLWKSDFGVIKNTGNEIEDEIRFHIEEREQKLIQSGVPPERAKLEAEGKFGDIFAIRNECLEDSGLRMFLGVRKLVQIAILIGTVAIGYKGWNVAKEFGKVKPISVVAPEKLPDFGVKTLGWNSVGFLEIDSPKFDSPIIDQPELTVLKHANVRVREDSEYLIDWRYRETSETAIHSKELTTDIYSITAKPNQSLPDDRLCSGIVTFDQSIVGLELKDYPGALGIDYVSGYKQLPNGCKLRVGLERNKLLVVQPPNAEPIELKVYVSAAKKIELDLSSIDRVHEYLRESPPKERARLVGILAKASSGKLQESLIDSILSEKLDLDAPFWKLGIQVSVAQIKAHQFLCDQRVDSVLEITSRFIPVAEHVADIYPNGLFALRNYRVYAMLNSGRYREAKTLATQTVDDGVLFGDQLSIENPLMALAEIEFKMGNSAAGIRRLQEVLRIAERKNNSTSLVYTGLSLIQKFILANEFEKAKSVIASIEETINQQPESVFAYKFRCYKSIVECSEGDFDGEYRKLEESVKGGLDGVPEQVLYLHYFAIRTVEKDFRQDFDRALWASDMSIDCLKNRPSAIPGELVNRAGLLLRMGRLGEAEEILIGLEGKFPRNSLSESKRLRMLSKLQHSLPGKGEKSAFSFSKLLSILQSHDQADSYSITEIVEDIKNWKSR